MIWGLRGSNANANQSTMWKFHDFSITQILREINFGDSKNAICPILTHLVAFNFDSHDFLHFWKAEIDQINNIQPPKIAKMPVL